VCAIDESDEAEGVLKAGATLASAYAARLSLVHIVEVPIGAIEIDFTPYWEGLRDAANLRLRELKARVGVEAPHKILEGPIAHVLLQQAANSNADLIVTGRGHCQGSLISRLGSQLYKIVRDSPCPVLSI
jgi:nucleotide-binding universal stress UspA family protein